MKKGSFRLISAFTVVFLRSAITIGGSVDPTDSMINKEPVLSTSVEKPKGFTNFITRSGDKLMDGGAPFRFIGVNNMDAFTCQDQGWLLATAFEQEDYLKTLVDMGAAAVRTYVFSVKGGLIGGTNLPYHYGGPGIYNEAAFVAVDRWLTLCNEYGIRTTLGFICNMNFFGGVPEFAGFRGKSGSEFYTDATVISDFKNYINYIVNRTNTLSGVIYKNDKAILCWETGNELNPTETWTTNIAAYIKSLDANHLVMDGGGWNRTTYGGGANGSGFSSLVLADPNVDIVTKHYYTCLVGNDYASACNSDRNFSMGKKPFIVGEFGINRTPYFHSLMDTVIANGTAGAWLWAMKGHAPNGGFYWHTENSGMLMDDIVYPGFSATSHNNDEINVVNLLREHGYGIRGQSVPAMAVPAAPAILPSSLVSAIKWQGSAGAQSYIIERATTSGGPFVQIASGVLDSGKPYVPYNDAPNGGSHFYRMKAVNTSGTSGVSAVFQVPPAPPHMVDELSDYSKMYSHTANLIFDGNHACSLGGDTSRLTRSTNTIENIVYHHTARNMVAFEMDTYYWNGESKVDMKIYTSPTGATYTEFVPAKNDLGGDWDRIKLSGSLLPVGTRYLKIEFRNTTLNNWNPQIGRISITYSGGSTATPPSTPTATGTPTP
jgi:hypothetical protein